MVRLLPSPTLPLAISPNLRLGHSTSNRYATCFTTHTTRTTILRCSSSLVLASDRKSSFARKLSTGSIIRTWITLHLPIRQVQSSDRLITRPASASCSLPCATLFDRSFLRKGPQGAGWHAECCQSKHTNEGVAATVRRQLGFG